MFKLCKVKLLESTQWYMWFIAHSQATSIFFAGLYNSFISQSYNLKLNSIEEKKTFRVFLPFSVWKPIPNPLILDAFVSHFQYSNVIYANEDDTFSSCFFIHEIWWCKVLAAQQPHLHSAIDSIVNGTVLFLPYINTFCHVCALYMPLWIVLTVLFISMNVNRFLWANHTHYFIMNCFRIQYTCHIQDFTFLCDYLSFLWIA